MRLLIIGQFVKISKPQLHWFSWQACLNTANHLFFIFKNHFELQLLELSFTIRSILHQFKNPAKQSTFNKRIISRKNFMAIPLVVYAVGTTKFLKYSQDIIINNSFKFNLNISKFQVKIGQIVPYQCAKFKRYPSIRRFFLGSKLLL